MATRETLERGEADSVAVRGARGVTLSPYRLEVVLLPGSVFTVCRRGRTVDGGEVVSPNNFASCATLDDDFGCGYTRRLLRSIRETAAEGAVRPSA